MRQLRRVGTVLLAAILVTGLGVAPAYADTGGGCSSNDWKISVCISVRSGTTNPLISDYYLTTTGNGEWSADVWVLYNNSNGGPCTMVNGANNIYKGNVTPVWTGHSPVWSTYKPAGANCARTYVSIRNSSGTWLYDNYSPWERW